MRNLFILRGAPASGKSTWIRENNLEPYTLSADTIRVQVCNPQMTMTGNYEITQSNDGKVWRKLFDLLEERMKNGDFTIIDATHYKSSLINRYKDLVSKYRYRVNVVDFSKVSEEELLRRNNTRDEYKRVPDEVISKMVIALSDDTEVKKAYKIISPEEALAKIKGQLEPINLDTYKQVVVFGDLHGCYEPLKQYFAEHPFNDETSYIFTGDYIDRGLQNKEVLQFLMAIYSRPNVALLEGNHERWLRIYCSKEYDITKYQNKTVAYKDLQLTKLANCINGYIELFTSKKNKLQKSIEEVFELKQDDDFVFYHFEQVNVNDYAKQTNKLIKEYNEKISKLTKLYNILIVDNSNTDNAVTAALDYLHSLNLGCNINIEKQILEKYNVKSEDNPIKSSEFLNKTVPQIEELDKGILRRLCDKFIQLSYFEFKGKQYLVTHGGLPKMPTILTSTEQIIKGVGTYELATAVDLQWSATENIISIHGHRNVFKEDAKISELAYNLCSEVEFGSPLRVMTITDDIKIEEYNNPIFEKEEDDKTKLTNLEILKELANNKYITAKRLNDHIMSLNFSHEAFMDKKWNTWTCTARGLFVDETNGNIVARSYPKFFNWGEVREVESANLKEVMTFPVTAYKKENGFLGLLSIYNDKVRIFTKSSDDSEFTHWFTGALCEKFNIDSDGDTYIDLFAEYRKLDDKLYKLSLSPIVDVQLREEIVAKFVSIMARLQDMKMRLCEYLLPKLKRGVTYIFEAILYEHDRHIIKYNKNDVILLDIVKNTLETDEFLPYNELVKEANELGFTCKQISYTFNNWDELYSFRQKMKESDDILYEGWVFTSNNMFRVKMKSKFYRFWKQMRTILQNLQRSAELKKVYKDRNEIIVCQLLKQFTREELLEKDIIDIEEMFTREISKCLKEPAVEAGVPSILE